MVIILFISGCTGLSNPENKIIGKWQEIEGTETLEFYKDGTISIVGDISATGNYKFIDDNTMRVDFGSLGSIVLKTSISNDELILTEANGDVSKYKRVDNTNDGILLNKKTNNIKIQEKLETPEGVIVKIELDTKDVPEGTKYVKKIVVKGVVENPTNNIIKINQAGILYKRIDENDLDKNIIWDWNIGLGYSGDTTNLGPRRSLPLSFVGYIEDSTTEIIPYIEINRQNYPKCFPGDPRYYSCYEYKNGVRVLKSQ